MSNSHIILSDSGDFEDSSDDDLTDGEGNDGPTETRERRFRNLLEKRRRDKYNGSIEDLRAMLPGVPAGKMDKLAVLKATVAYMKTHNDPEFPPKEQEARSDWKPSILTDEEFSYLMLDALSGFIVVMSEIGKILYISESVTSLLGHLPEEIVNGSIFDLVHKPDKYRLTNILKRHPETGCKVEYSVSLNIRLGRLEAPNQKTKYQLVKFNGHYKRFAPIPNGENKEVKCIFVCIGRLLDADLLNDMSTFVDSGSVNMEFCSKQSMEWKFIYVDERALPIIGYTSFELLGTSGYDYIHVEDLERLAAGHEQLIKDGNGTSCYYRFLTKGQQWIWLQSQYRITNGPRAEGTDTVDCIHRVVSYVDVMKDIRSKSTSAGPSASFTPKSEVVEESMPHSSKSASAGSTSTASASPAFTTTATRGTSPPRPVCVNPNQSVRSHQTMNNLDPLLASYLQPSMALVASRRAAFPLPVAAFYLNPIPTNSNSALVGYSSGILLAPSFQEQLLLNQQQPTGIPSQHQIMQRQPEFQRISEQTDTRQGYLLGNGQSILIPNSSQPSNVNPFSVPNFQSPLGYPSQQFTRRM